MGYFLVIVAIWIAAVIGWILNIVDLVNASGLSGLVVARAIGILVFPLGAVLGYF